MQKNIFQRAKDAVREAQATGWQWCDADEAAKYLLTSDPTYADGLYDDLATEDALAEFFTEHGMRPGKIPLNLPSMDEGNGHEFTVLGGALKGLYIVDPKNRSYSDCDVRYKSIAYEEGADDEGKPFLYAAEPEKINFESILQKIDHFARLAPKAYKSITYDGKEYVLASGRDSDPAHCLFQGLLLGIPLSSSLMVWHQPDTGDVIPVEKHTLDKGRKDQFEQYLALEATRHAIGDADPEVRHQAEELSRSLQATSNRAADEEMKAKGYQMDRIHPKTEAVEHLTTLGITPEFEQAR